VTIESSPTASDGPPAVAAAVMEEADRIIAAASHVDGVEAEEPPASVSAEGVAETIVGEGAAVATEAALSQQIREEGSETESPGKILRQSTCICIGIAVLTLSPEVDCGTHRAMVPFLQDTGRAMVPFCNDASPCATFIQSIPTQKSRRFSFPLLTRIRCPLVECSPYPHTSHHAVGPVRAVVAVASVEPPHKEGGQADVEADTSLESDSELLMILAVPGLEAAVKAKCLLHFPKKEKEQDPANLQRSNSI